MFFGEMIRIAEYIRELKKSDLLNLGNTLTLIGKVYRHRTEGTLEYIKKDLEDIK